MPERNTLTKKQHAVIDDLFTGTENEQQILEKHKVSRGVYEKWQSDALFLREFEFRLNRERRQTDLLIARYAASAVAKLLDLINSANPETARKACLDIITLLRPDPKRPDSQPDDSSQTEKEQELSPELASKLLLALAESKNICRPIEY